jgi:hypothetical protein
MNEPEQGAKSFGSMVTAMILTFNEEPNIARTLDVATENACCVGDESAFMLV